VSGAGLSLVDALSLLDIYIQIVVLYIRLFMV
jgi:hypothetical protein